MLIPASLAAIEDSRSPQPPAETRSVPAVPPTFLDESLASLDAAVRGDR
ncbi:hypothetical protein [Rhodococcus sp. NBC_00294]|nr:hypothetical protein [Rhodococcus sp. NBC_00294]